jgi:hypothetical protein
VAGELPAELVREPAHLSEFLFELGCELRERRLAGAHEIELALDERRRRLEDP